MNALSLCLFLSSLAIVATCFFVNVRRRWIITMLALGYCFFCLVAFGKVEGFIPSSPIKEMVNQNGFDLRRLPIPIEDMIEYASAFGTLFNLVTTLWIFKRWGFWKWCICSATGFCVICAAAGPVFEMSPLYSLFGGCCAFMLLVGWVFGLTYIQFCVIGNIWIPIIAALTSALTLLYVTFLNKKTSGLTKYSIILWVMCQCTASFIIGIHYALPMKDAFFLCVSDLKQLAQICHTTYAVVNLVIYVFGIVVVISANISLIRKSLLSLGRLEKKVNKHLPSGYGGI